MKSPELGRRWSLWCLAAWLLCFCQASAAFDLQGHRGARGLAPENTLAAFSTALDLGVTTLELDLGQTRDGVLVIAHDQRLNPNLTRDAQGHWLPDEGARPALRALTLAELQAYDVGRLKPGTAYAQTFSGQQAVDGQRIPTLDALFDMVKARGDTRVRFNIETKLTPHTPELAPDPEAFVAALLAVLDRHQMRARVSLESFDWRTLQVMHKLAPVVPTVALSTQQGAPHNIADPRWTAGLRLQDHGDSVPRMVKAVGARVWSPHHVDLNAGVLAQARSLGLQVIPWTVNEPAHIDRVLALGVDGIISDYPDRVRTAMARRGMALPP
jgi:glycerophosphoryl diester phosphodiesterase